EYENEYETDYEYEHEHERGGAGIIRRRTSNVERRTPPYWGTRSQASGGIQWASLPSHLTLQPMGFVSGTDTGLPEVCSSRARSRSLTVMRLASRGLSTPRPVYTSRRSRSNT